MALFLFGNYIQRPQRDSVLSQILSLRYLHLFSYRYQADAVSSDKSP